MTTPHNSVPYSWNLPLNIDGKILNAAYDVILDKGIDNATISEIASRAGISRPTLYRRFADINAVFFSLITSLVLDVMNRRYQLVDTVDELIDTLLDFVIELREQPIFRQLAESDQGFLANYFVKRLGDSQRESLAVLASLIHHCRAVDPAQLRDEDDMELAAMIIMILQGTSLSIGSMSSIVSNDTWRRHLKYALTGLLSPTLHVPSPEIPPTPEASASARNTKFGVSTSSPVRPTVPSEIFPGSAPKKRKSTTARRGKGGPTKSTAAQSVGRSSATDKSGKSRNTTQRSRKNPAASADKDNARTGKADTE